jgi:hypothetical protein
MTAVLSANALAYVHQLGSQLADHHASVVLRKGIGLYDDRRTGLTIVTGCRNGHQVTASHLRQTRRPLRSISARRARDPVRGRRPALPPFAGPPASGGRRRRDATRADSVRAAAASSSSFQPATPWASPSETCDGVMRYKRKAGAETAMSGLANPKPEGASGDSVPGLTVGLIWL